MLKFLISSRQSTKKPTIKIFQYEPLLFLFYNWNKIFFPCQSLRDNEQRVLDYMKFFEEHYVEISVLLKTNL